MFDVLAGTGGTNPTVKVLHAGQTEVTELLTLPLGHSVYALDVVPALRQAAAGTRAGTIHLLNPHAVPTSGAITFTNTLIQGAPVLSVCLLGDGCLASADTAGRCLLWHLHDEPDKPMPLPVQGGQIGSLHRLADDTLAGVSDRGYVHVWNITDAKLLRTVRGPVPSQPLALARLQCWPSADVLVYPAGDGSIAFFTVGNAAIRAIPAHRGTSCAVAVADGEIHTIGFQDGLLKMWRTLQGKPARTYRAPVGIVSIEALPGETMRWILVGTSGEAGIYTAASGVLHLKHRLKGGDYRTVSAAPALQRASLRQQLLREQATALIEQIQAKIESGEFEGIEELFTRLSNDGLEAEALALRAHLAAKQGDLVQELSQRSRLARLLPRDGRSGVLSLRRYAQVLESAWQLAAAQEMYSRTGSTGDSRTEADWLVRGAEIMRGADWVAAPGTPLLLLVRAATAVGQPFVGRWVLQTAKPMVIPVGGFTSGMIAAKYEQVRSEETRRPLPTARAQTAWWLAPNQMRQAELLLFVDTTFASPAYLCPGLEIRPNGLQTIAIPMLLLDAAAARPGESAESHNDSVLRYLEENALEAQAGNWPPVVRHAVGLALRRLRNQARTRVAC